MTKRISLTQYLIEQQRGEAQIPSQHDLPALLVERPADLVELWGFRWAGKRQEDVGR